MSHSNKKTPALLLSVLALSVGLSACNKSKNTAESTTATSSTSTTTTTVVETASSTDMTALPASATDLTLASAPASTTDGTQVASGVAVTSATAITALQMANVGDPKDTLKNVFEALRVGRVTHALGFIESSDKNLKKSLVQSLPRYKDIKTIKYSVPKYNEDKTMAMVSTLTTTKTDKNPIEVPYLLQKTMTGWKVLLNAAPPTTRPPLMVNPAPNGVPNAALQTLPNGKIKGNPAIKPRTDNVVVAKTVAGTPEDAFKKAMNTMIKAPASEAVKYYISTQPALNAQQANTQANLQAMKQADSTKTSKSKQTGKKSKQAIPAQPAMPTLEEKVAMQQALFQQALQSVKLGKTQYSKDKTEAIVNAVFTPYAKTGSKPQEMAVRMKKDSNGEWKIISD